MDRIDISPELLVYVNLLVSLMIGALVGLERGWSSRDDEKGPNHIGGIRTFSLVGLLGGVSSLLANSLGWWLPVVALGGVSILLAVSYTARLRRHGDLSMTTHIALLLVFCLSLMVGAGFMEEAIAVAVATAVILSLKPVFHSWVQRLTAEELRAALGLLVLSFLVLPVLPNRGFGPWAAINPYTIWWMVVLVAGISFVGYVAVKVAGARKGLVLTSFFAGLVSSTALTLQFSRMARNAEPEMQRWLSVGVLVACATVYPRMLLVASVVNVQVPLTLWPVFALMAVVTLLPAVFYWRGAPRDAMVQHQYLPNPLDLTSALMFGVLLGAIMFLAKALLALFGTSGLFALAALSGISDVDAINLSFSRMALDGLPLQTAAYGITIAVAVNSVIKGGLAIFANGAGLSWRVAAPLFVAAVVGLGVMWWVV